MWPLLLEEVVDVGRVDSEPESLSPLELDDLPVDALLLVEPDDVLPDEWLEPPDE
ncbi:MAG: hypothetical protein AB9M53_03900 [Leptothrix sp. (in: b-proteobacteria)]